MDPVLKMRSPAATSSGAGLALILIWLWNGILAPRSGLPEMPAEVAGAITLLVADLFRLWLGTRPAPLPQAGGEPAEPRA